MTTRYHVGYGRKKICIKENWIVLDIGSGHNPHVRANILVDSSIDKTIHRTEASIKIPRGIDFIMGDCHFLPFKDKSFDFVIASHIAEHVDNPELFCKELFRVGKRGFIETPGITSDILLNELYHSWRVFTMWNTIYFLKKCRFTPIWDIFYQIFYYGRDMPGHKSLEIKRSKIIPLLYLCNYLLCRFWKYLPLTYTYFDWKDQIHVKVIS